MQQQIVSDNLAVESKAFELTPPTNRESNPAPMTLSQILQKKANMAKLNYRTQTQQVLQPGSQKGESILSVSEKSDRFGSNEKNKEEDVVD